MLTVDHNADMAGKEDHIPALQGLVIADGRADAFALKIAVAGNPDARLTERKLHQPGAVDATVAAPAPHIGLADLALGGGDPVFLERSGWKDMAPMHRALFRDDEIAFLDPGDPRPGGQCVHHRRLYVRLRKDRSQPGGDIVGRVHDTRSQRIRLQIADIAVMLAKAPGPAAGYVKKMERLAKEQLRYGAGACRAALSQESAAARAMHRLCLGVMRGEQDASEAYVRKVSAH